MMHLALVVTLAVAVGPPPPMSVSVTPALIELSAPPGGSATETVSLTNRGARPMVVTPEVWDYALGAQGRYVPVPPASRPSTVAPWFVVQPASAVVPVNQSGTFKVTVSVPAAVRGSAYAVVYLGARQQLDPARGDTGVSVGAEIVVRVLINTGTVQPSLRARILSAAPPTASTKLHVAVELRNDGETHVLAEPSLDIVGPLQDFVAYVPPDREQVLLLPGETKAVSFEWPGELAPADYSLVASAYYGQQKVAVAERDLVVAEPAPVVAPPARREPRAPTAAGRAEPPVEPRQRAVVGTPAREPALPGAGAKREPKGGKRTGDTGRGKKKARPQP